MPAPEKTRQDQVKELIEKGGYTKKAIAEELGVPVNSVSSQLTYLRWKGKCIMTNPETKVLSFVSEEELAAHEASIAAARQAKANAATSKTPQERANALATTIKRQETQFAAANTKIEQIEKDLADEPNDAELLELLDEAKANATLLRIKIKRNKALAETLPVPEPMAETVTTPVEPAEPENNDLDEDGDLDTDPDDDDELE